MVPLAAGRHEALRHAAKIVLREDAPDQRKEDVVFGMDVRDEAADGLCRGGREGVNGAKTVAVLLDGRHRPLKTRQRPAENPVFVAQDGCRPFYHALKRRKERPLFIAVMDEDLLFEERERGAHRAPDPGRIAFRKERTHGGAELLEARQDIVVLVE